MSNIYNVIADRLLKRHRIMLGNHVQSITKTGHSLGVGITFTAKDHSHLEKILSDSPFFTHDNRTQFCDTIAASQTDGEAYRELGAPSLHCAIASSHCSIHLDTYGFVAIGPDGKKYYNLDLVQHIVDDLGWALVANWAHKKNPTIGSILGNLHPVVPNSTNNYKAAVGGKLDIAKGKGWSLTIEATYSINHETLVTGKANILTW